MSWPVPPSASPAERLAHLDREVIAPALRDLRAGRLGWVDVAVESVLRRSRPRADLGAICDAVCGLTRPLYRPDDGADTFADVSESMAWGDDCEGLSAAAVVILAGVARRAAWAAGVRGVPCWLVYPGAPSDHVALAVAGLEGAPTIPRRVLLPSEDLPPGWSWCDPSFAVPFGEHPVRWSMARRGGG